MLSAAELARDAAAIAAQSQSKPTATPSCKTCGLKPTDDAVADAKVKLSPCSVCKTTFYCSRECQLKDWKSHKPLCRPAVPPTPGEINKLFSTYIASIQPELTFTLASALHHPNLSKTHLLHLQFSFLPSTSPSTPRHQFALLSSSLVLPSSLPPALSNQFKATLLPFSNSLDKAYQTLLTLTLVTQPQRDGETKATNLFSTNVFVPQDEDFIPPPVDEDWEESLKWLLSERWTKNVQWEDEVRKRVLSSGREGVKEAFRMEWESVQKRRTRQMMGGLLEEVREGTLKV